MLGPQDQVKEKKAEDEPVKEQPDKVDPIEDDSLEQLAVARSLRIEKLDDIKVHRNRLQRIVEWAKAQGAKTQVDIAAEVNGLKNRLGNPSIYDVSAYVILDGDKQDIEKKLKKFEK
jgi:hypothetical protein